MKRALALLFFCLTVLFPAQSFASAFAGNTLDDMFSVKSIDEKEAVLEGNPKNLKEGDLLYFVRSPFKFPVTSVKGNKVTVSLPRGNDLAKGNTLMRHPTEQVKKALDTESRLKQALEE